MIRYKFTNKKETSVDNLETSQKGIHPKVWLWRGYQEWLAEGNTTEPYQNPEEVAQEEVAEQVRQEKAERDLDVELARSAEGLKEVTIQQARNWINAQYKDVTTVEELVAANKKILMRIIPFII